MNRDDRYDVAPLREAYKAGLRRDYDHNGREYYRTEAEADAFNDGLKASMERRPIDETRFKFVSVRHITLDELLALMSRKEACLLQCGACSTVVDEFDCEPTDSPGVRKCPCCGDTGMLAMDESRLDDEYPWRVCEHCGHAFLWDDALGGGGEPGSYICPRCGGVT